MPSKNHRSVAPTARSPPPTQHNCALRIIAHVGKSGRQPNTCPSRHRDHRPTSASMRVRSTPTSADASARRRCPAASTISMIPGCMRSHDCALTGSGRQSGTKDGCGGSAAACSASTASRRHRNSRLGAMPWRRATAETVVAEFFASAKIACFCSRVHARRVPAITTCVGFDIAPDMVPT